MIKLKYKNFVNDSIGYLKNEEEQNDKKYFLSDFKLTSDQDMLCQLLDKLGSVIVPYDISEEHGVIRYMYFKIEDNNKHYASFLFDEEGKLDDNIERELRIENVKLSKEWKEFYVSKGFSLMRRSEILKIND